jgi:Protein of unknown function (DUF3224)
MDDTRSYSHKAVCRFRVASWDEKVVTDIDGDGTTYGEVYYPKRGLSRAEVAYTYTGQVEGTSAAVYLLGYRNGDDLVLALERFTGSVDGHEGSCVFQHTGSHDASSVRGRLQVVPGLGTGDLRELRGEADLLLEGHSEDGYELVLHYDLG